MLAKIKKLNPQATLPSYAHPGDAGLDMYTTEGATLLPGEHKIFYCGWAMELSEDTVGIVKDRGSMAKKGIHTMGGVYDSGFRGEYNVFLINLSQEPYEVKAGDKIAQLIILPFVRTELMEVDELSDTSRGLGQFGSTGR